MRVMLDTNVLISAFVLSSSYLLKLIEAVSEHHSIVLSTYIVDELKRVTHLKFQNQSERLESFLHELPYELAYTPDKIDQNDYPGIRDIKDLPILVSAINEGVDVLISSDKDFAPLNMEYPEILTPNEFVEKYC